MTPVRILSFSDCHLGNPRLDSHTMCQHLSELVFPLIEQCDFIIIGGDLFDLAIGLSDQQTIDILTFLGQFLYLTNLHNVTVRILRGTYSHDRTQPAVIPVLHKQYKYTNDLKYYDRVSLEYIERFDMQVLYIPDDVPYPSSVAVMEEVAIQMAGLGWSSLDYAFVHGYFQHVLPEHASAKPKLLYTQEQFGFVRRYVLIGHVHEGSINGKFIYNGSTDRLVHGEEGPKGLITVDDQVKRARVKFHPNPKATIFKTLDYSTVSQEDEIVAILASDLVGYDRSLPVHVRILHPKSDIRIGLKRWMAIHYPWITVSHKSSNKDSSTLSVEIENLLDMQLLSPPTPDTLAAMILDQLVQQGVVTRLTPSKITEMLESAKH